MREYVHITASAEDNLKHICCMKINRKRYLLSLIPIQLYINILFQKHYQHIIFAYPFADALYV